jgi:phage terminase large subunit
MTKSKINPNLNYLFENVPGNRVTLLQGGTRSGKTYSTINYLIYMCVNHTDMEIDITRDTFKALRATAWKDFEDVLKSFNMYNSDDHNKSEGTYKLNGNIINYFGSDNDGKVHGKSRDILWINEAQLMSPSVVDQLMPRTRHRIIMDYNPALGDDHWLDEYIDTYPPLVTTYRDNPHLTNSQVEDIESRQDNKYWWSIYGKGERSRVEGAIFTNWSEGDFDDSLPIWYGQDYGFSNDPTTLVKVAVDDKNKIIYAKELLYETHLSTDQIGQINTKHVEGGLIIGDSAEPRLIAELRRTHNLNVQGAKKVTINEGIVMMNNYRIIVTPDSLNLKSELSKYKWQDKGRTVPIDNYNHLIDALRYACMWRLSRPNYGKYAIA